MNDDLMHCLESPVIKPKEGRPLSNRLHTSVNRNKVKSLSISKIAAEKPKPVKRRIVFSTYDNLQPSSDKVSLIDVQLNQFN